MREFLEKTGAEMKIEKFLKKVWKFENNAYLCSPFEKRVLERGFKKFIEKTVLLYKKQVPRKNTIYREALISL